MEFWTMLKFAKIGSQSRPSRYLWALQLGSKELNKILVDNFSSNLALLPALDFCKFKLIIGAIPKFFIKANQSYFYWSKFKLIFRSNFKANCTEAISKPSLLEQFQSRFYGKSQSRFDWSSFEANFTGAISKRILREWYQNSTSPCSPRWRGHANHIVKGSLRHSTSKPVGELHPDPPLTRAGMNQTDTTNSNH